MLKWTVIGRRDGGADKSEASRRLSLNPQSAEKSRRASRRSSLKRRSSFHRYSFNLEEDKENQFTSTPLKNHEDHHQSDALRDVGNLTPKETYQRRILSAKKTNSLSPTRRKKHKKKKLCQMTHEIESVDKKTKNYFRPFETVDSHIEGVLVDDFCGCKQVKRGIQETYAGNFVKNTPSLYLSPKATPLGKFLALEEGVPNKRVKIDHVNDFLKQLTCVTSPEDDNKNLFPPMELKSAKIEPVKVSPLVKKFVDLRFSQISYKNRPTNQSSLIDDLSLDQIVDAILDSSGSDKNETKSPEKPLFLDRCSSDSGFKSSTTEISHHLQPNFTCKCSNNLKNEKTIINLTDTFNERCVDDKLIRTRKRSSDQIQSDPKRLSLDKSTCSDYDNFTLKRQRCIRRRRPEDDKKKKASPVKNKDDEESFDAMNISGCIADDDKSTPLQNKLTDETYLVTPVDTSSRGFRRCLLFESPTSLSEGVSSISSNCSVGEIRGSMDLNIRYENSKLLVHGELHTKNISVLIKS